MVGLERRWMPYNGSLSPASIEWLRNLLSRCKDNGESAIVMSHVPLGPGSTEDCALLWNFDEIARVLSEHRGVVKACFAGHDHGGGYSFVDGVHFKTAESPLEPRSDESPTSFGIVHVYRDRMELEGFGRVPNMVWPIS